MSQVQDEITKSRDPKLVASRVFVGSLPSDRTSREELEEKFSKYGKILGISIHQGFGFVQYEDELAAVAAVQEEQGCYFKGKKLDLRVASEGKKDKPPRGPPMKRPHEDFPPGGPPGGPPFDEPYHRGPPMPPTAPWEREPYGPPGPLPPRGPPEPFRDDPYMRDRFGPPPPGGPPPVDTFHRGEPFGGPPGPKRVEYGVERPFDSVIIAVNKHLKMYAEMVERKLIELNMTVDVIFLVHDDALLKAIDDMVRRGVLYILVVQPQHEDKRSITVNIMHGTPQEHRNMPLDEALQMLHRNFQGYLSSLRSGSEQPSMGFLLNLLSDGKHLTVAELDRIIAHLQDRRDRIIEAEGGKVVSREITPAAGAPVDQIQQRIFNILGGNSANIPGGGGAPAAAPNPNPTALLASVAQQLGLNLNLPPGAGGVAPPTSMIPPIPGKDTGPNVKPPLDTGLTKTLDSLLQNPLLKSLVPQPNAIGGNRPPFPPAGGMAMPPGKPPGESDLGMGPGIRPPQPPMSGRGGPGPGF